MDYPFSVPGYEGHRFFMRPGGLLGSLKIFCDGVKAQRKGAKHICKLSDGREVVFQLKFTADIFNPKISHNGYEFQAMPKLPFSQLVMIYLPLALGIQGGALGGLCGAVSAFANNALLRSNLPLGIKWMLTFLSIMAAIVAYFILAVMASGVIRRG